MSFFVTHRFSATSRARGRSMLRAGRLLVNVFHARANLTPQERANLFVSQTPIAVVTASLGGHAADSAADHR